MRKVAILVVAVALVVGGLLLALPHIVDANHYHSQVQRELQSRLNRSVEFKQLSLGIFPLRMKAGNVVIGEDPRFHSSLPFAQVVELDLRVRLFPLLRGQLDITSLEMKRPAISLIRNPQGIWNFATLASAAVPAPIAAPPPQPPTQQGQTPPSPAAPAPAQPQYPAPPAPAPAAVLQANGMVLNEVKIKDGQIAITDYRKGEPRVVYDHIDVTLKDYAPDRPFSLDLTAHLPGNGSQRLRLRGTGGPVANAEFAGMPFKGRLQVDEVSLASAGRFLNSGTLRDSEGLLSGATDLSSSGGTMSASGSLKLTSAVIRGVPFSSAISADFDLSDDLSHDRIQIRKCALKLGSTPIVISGTVDKSAGVDLSLEVAKGKVDDLLDVAKVYGVPEDVGGSGEVAFDLHVSGPVKPEDQLAVIGSGKLRKALLRTPSLSKPVSIQNADMQFSQGSVKLTNLTASLGSTNARGRVSISNFRMPRLTFALSADKINVSELEQIIGKVDREKAPQKHRANASWNLVPRADASPAPQPRPGFLQTVTGSGTIAAGTIVYQRTVLTAVRSDVTLNHAVIELNPITSQVFGGQESGSITVDTRARPMTCAVKARLSKVDANQVLSSISSVKDKLYGTLNAATDVTFATPPSGDIMPTLNGSVIVSLADGKLMKLDLPAELAKIGKFGGVTPKGYTAISQMSGSFTLRNGVAQTNDMKGALDIGTMSANGSMNLLNQELEVHVIAVLNRQFSQSIGGTAVGGYLTTALSNKDGELVLPVLITGMMNRPLVAPDLQQIARMKVQNILNGKGGGKNLGGVLRDLLGGQKSVDATQQQNPTQGQAAGTGKKP